MKKNDCIAEYVKEKYPELIHTTAFNWWLFKRGMQKVFTADNRGDEDLEIAIEKALEQMEEEEEEVKWHFEEYADKHGYDRDYDDLFHFGLGRARQIVKRLIDDCK